VAVDSSAPPAGSLLDGTKQGGGGVDDWTDGAGLLEHISCSFF
jgi:hypothetical protein